MPHELLRSEQAGCDLVFIDTPPGRSTESPAAVEACDLVLIPFLNDQDAYDGVQKTAGLARRLGKSAHGILTFATPNSLIHAETARDVLDAIPLPFAPAVLHRYDVHRLASVVGLTAQELEPESVAAAEVGALWMWLCAVLQLETNSDVQTRTDATVHRGAA